jgi:hypothetical protein
MHGLAPRVAALSAAGPGTAGVLPFLPQPAADSGAAPHSAGSVHLGPQLRAPPCLRGESQLDRPLVIVTPHVRQ